MKTLLKSLVPSPLKPLARKVAAGSRRAQPRVERKLNDLKHHAGCLMRGKKEQHLVILGFSRSGTSMLHQMISSTVQNAWVSEDEEYVRFTRNVFDARICTKRPLDIFEVMSLEEEMSYRDFKIICVVRDPRDLVSSHQTSVAPDQFFQGMDYSFFKTRSGLSFCKPGISAAFEKIRELSARDNVLLVKYEDLIADPEAVKVRISDFSGFELKGNFSDFHRKKASKSIEEALNSSRPIEKQDAPSWLKPGRLERALAQLDQFPEMEKVVSFLGYQPTKDVLEKHGIKSTQVEVSPPGHIVGFNTSDPLYTEEARRFKARLDELGLSYDVTVVPPREDWVNNCAIKPSILKNARDKMHGPILYTDVDAYFHKNPWPLLTQHADCDLAAFVKPDGELLSGTLLINDTSAARELLEEWVRRQEASESTWDQRVLQEIIYEDEARPQRERKYRFHRLSPCMTYIFDGNGFDYLYNGPVIEHLQASRETTKKGSAHLERRHARLKELFS